MPIWGIFYSSPLGLRKIIHALKTSGLNLNSKPVALVYLNREKNLVILLLIILLTNNLEHEKLFGESTKGDCSNSN